MQPVAVTVTNEIPDGLDDDLRVRLPLRSAEKLIAVRDAIEVATAARQAAADQRAHLREEVAHLRGQLRDYEARGGAGGQEGQGIRASIERRQIEMARLEELTNRRGAEVASSLDLLRRTYRLFADVPASRIRPVVVDAKLRRSENLSDALARVRGEIEAIESERLQVEAAPLPSALVKQAMRTQIEALAAEGQLDVSSLFYARPMALPRVIQAAPPNGPRPDFERLPADLGAVALAVIAPTVIDHLAAKIDALAERLDSTALTPEEKADRLKALAARHLDLERAEEAILDQLGGTVPRRNGIDPRAWLGVEIVDELDVPEAA